MRICIWNPVSQWDRLSSISPLIYCSVCRQEQLHVELDITAEWVQCKLCQPSIQFFCANRLDQELYIWVRCLPGNGNTVMRPIAFMKLKNISFTLSSIPSRRIKDRVGQKRWSSERQKQGRIDGAAVKAISVNLGGTIIWLPALINMVIY